MFAYGGTDPGQTYAAAAANHPLLLEVVRRNPHAESRGDRATLGDGAHLFSWFGRNRRFAKDYESLATTVQSFVTLAAIRFGVRRLARNQAFGSSSQLLKA